MSSFWTMFFAGMITGVLWAILAEVNKIRIALELYLKGRSR